jgi:hypothetical protein
MKEATNENRVDTAERAEISTELEDAELCVRLWEPSDDLRLAGSNETVCGRLFTIAMPSYWCTR